jgi:hypothetical protein
VHHAHVLDAGTMLHRAKVSADAPPSSSLESRRRGSIIRPPPPGVSHHGSDLLALTPPLERVADPLRYDTIDTDRDYFVSRVPMLKIGFDTKEQMTDSSPVALQQGADVVENLEHFPLMLIHNLRVARN